MEDWIERLTEALGEPAVAPAEMGALLKLSRDVAHGVERRFAPLSTFVLGAYVGRRVGEGAARDQAVAEGLAAARGLLPDDEERDVDRP